MELTSAQNTFLKSVRRAAATGRATEDGLVVVEGPHLLEEALRSFWNVEKILTTTNGFERYGKLLRMSRAEIVRVSGRAFAAVASTETAQEIMALLRPHAWSLSEIWQGRALLVALDAIQDPGNAGTIVRSAEAFGATGVIFLEGCVRIANGKFLRASAGSIFRLPFAEGINSKSFIREAAQNRIQTYALTATGQMLISEVDLGRSCCLITGNEGAGVSKDMLAQAQPVSIPTVRVESLNAAVACSLALFEAYKQRSV